MSKRLLAALDYPNADNVNFTGKCNKKCISMLLFKLTVISIDKTNLEMILNCVV